MDPNLIACKDYKELLYQLIDSGASIDINQGVDIRLITEDKAKLFSQLKMSIIHFAWDRYEDKDFIVPKFEMFKHITSWDYRKMTVFVLTNFNTTIDQDLDRVYTLRDLGYNPYIMIYDKEHTVPNDPVRKLQRWVNNRYIFRTVGTFDEYNKL